MLWHRPGRARLVHGVAVNLGLDHQGFINFSGKLESHDTHSSNKADQWIALHAMIIIECALSFETRITRQWFDMRRFSGWADKVAPRQLSEMFSQLLSLKNVSMSTSSNFLFVQAKIPIILQKFTFIFTWNRDETRHFDFCFRFLTKIFYLGSWLIEIWARSQTKTVKTSLREGQKYRISSSRRIFVVVWIWIWLFSAIFFNDNVNDF